MKELNRLLEIIADIAAGRYSNDVMGLTVSRVAEPVRTIAEAMGLMMVKVEAREYRLETLVKELEEMNQRVRRSTIAIVSSMAKALAARDAYTQGHAERVGQIAGLIAAEMGLPEEETDLIGLAGCTISERSAFRIIYSYHMKERIPKRSFEKSPVILSPARKF